MTNNELQKKLQSPQILETITTPIAVSQGELLLMLLKYAIVNELSHSAVIQLFKAVNCIFVTKVLPDSGYFIDKLFFSSEFVKYHAICPDCKNYAGVFVRSNREKQCYFCEKTFSVNGKNFNNFFATFNIKNNIKSLLEKYDHYYNSVMERVYERGVFSDIYDGMAYQRFLDSLLPEDRKRYVSFTFNCDGAPTFDSSNFSIYPVQVMINELPLEVRTTNVIVSALWFGKSKPDMNVLLKGFVDEMNELSNLGVECNIQGDVRLIKPFAICCAVDSVARAPMQGIKQYNGYYGCSWCLQKGEYVRNESDTGGCVKYPITEKVPKERNEANFFKCLDYIINKDTLAKALPPTSEEVTNNNNINVEHANTSESNCVLVTSSENLSAQNKKEEFPYGIQHVSPLNLLKSFEMIDGFVLEDMHFVRLGLGEQFTDYWVQRLTPANLKIVDKILESISVPHQSMRLTRSISDRTYWKAKEWENWILYFSIPIMRLFIGRNDRKSIMRLKHWALFVETFYISLKPIITRLDLERHEYLSKSFVVDVEKIYSKEAMTYNVHKVWHWPKSLETWGPSWAHNAFPFETGNGDLLKMIKAANGVTNQICRKLSMHQSDLILTNSIFPMSSPRVQMYCSRLQSRNTQKTSKINSCRYFGAPRKPNPNWVQKLGLTSEALSYKKMVKDKCLYSPNVQHNNRSNNSFAELQNGRFVKLREFIIDEKLEREYAVVRKIVTDDINDGLYPYLHKVTGSEEAVVAIPVECLEKIAIFFKVQDEAYICSMPNMFYF